MSLTSVQPDVAGLQRVLAWVERAGNALPHPCTLFALLSVVTVLLSALGSAIGLAVIHPGTGAELPVMNLLSADGLHRFVNHVVTNFTSFAPLGTVLTCLLGLALAEYSGLVGAVLRRVVALTPARLLTPVVVFGGVASHTGGDVGYVLFIPLSAALFHAVGRHPLVGLAAAFAGVSGGFAANLLLSTSDVLLSGLTQEAARMIDPTYVVTPMANYFFLAVSAFLITALGTWVTQRWVEPRFGTYRGDVAPEPLRPLTAVERRGLWAALAALAVLGAFIALSLLPGGLLHNPAKPGFMGSYFVSGLVWWLFLLGLLPGLAYGIVVGTIRSDADVVRAMTRAMETMAGYIVLAFFIAQFIALFNWTNLGVVLAVRGAALLQSLDLGPIVLMVGFVFLAAAIDLVIGSASAKWAVMAPVFVPMFMLLGYAPEMAQAAYRIGDSVANIVTPLMSFFPLVLTFAQRYVPSAGIGTLVSTMLPYSITFLVGWTVLLVGWILLGWPLGPGADLYLAKTAE